MNYFDNGFYFYYFPCTFFKQKKFSNLRIYRCSTDDIFGSQKNSFVEIEKKSRRKRNIFVVRNIGKTVWLQYFSHQLLQYVTENSIYLRSTFEEISTNFVILLSFRKIYFFESQLNIFEKSQKNCHFTMRLCIYGEL